MLVYLFRHGEAVPETVDPARPLSAKGEAEVIDTTMFLLADGLKVDEIWHSSKLRAKQTAAIIAKMLKVPRVVEMDGLKPDDDPAPVAAELQRLKSRDPSQTILIAGHLPFLPKLANLLDPKSKLKEIGTGEVVKVSF